MNNKLKEYLDEQFSKQVPSSENKTAQDILMDVITENLDKEIIDSSAKEYEQITSILSMYMVPVALVKDWDNHEYLIPQEQEEEFESVRSFR